MPRRMGMAGYRPSDYQLGRVPTEKVGGGQVPTESYGEKVDLSASEPKRKVKQKIDGWNGKD